MVPSYDWSGFRALVGGVHALAVGEDEAGSELAPVLRRALAMLYSSGATMPDAFEMLDAAEGSPVMLDAALDPIDDFGPDPHYAERELALIERLSDSVSQLQPDFDTSEPDDYLTAAVAATLAALQRLERGSELYDTGNVDRAAWEWSFGFDDWGGDVLTALAALHELLWGAGE